MTGIRLKLNNDKTGALLAVSRIGVSMSQDNHLRVGNHDSFFFFFFFFNHDSSFKGHVKNLRVYLNATLTRSAFQHISRSEELALFFLQEQI